MKGIFKSRLIVTGVALLLLVGALAVALVSSAHSHPARAYGKANWQVTFSGTFVTPGSGGGGFWGWCDFAGGIFSGNDGDCQFSQYQHAPVGSGIPSFNCEVSLDNISWDASGGTFVLNAATVTVHPTSQTANCSQSFPFDTGIPAKAGHYNFGGMGAVRGEFQAQVTQIP